MPPGIETARRLCKARLNLHTEEIVYSFCPGRCAEIIERLTLPRVRIGQQIARCISQIGDRLAVLVYGICSLFDVIVRHELTMCPGDLPFITAGDTAQSVIDFKIAVFLQMCKVLSGVILEVSALVVDTVHEQMIDRGHLSLVKQIGE